MDRDMQEPIVIDASTDELSVTVNGVGYTIQLDHRTYNTRQDLVDQINAKLAAKGIGLTATLSGKKIHYETTAKGNGASLKITYSGGGSAMKAIYGKTTVQHEGVKASFTSDGRLILTRDKNGGTISVSSAHGSVFQLPQVQTAITSPTRQTGRHSQKKAYIDGVNINEPVRINEWNKDMSFIFYDNGTKKNVQFQLTEKDYTFEELQKALQQEIDQDLGADKLTVTVTNQGVRLEAKQPGSLNYMRKSDFAGGFYYKVLCSSREAVKQSNPEDHVGSQSNDTAYVVGRKDVKNSETKIQTGVNDSLSLDFTYGKNTKKITMTLDAGTYSGNALKEQIQAKLNEQLKAMGLSENLIEVGIGDINTGITGANDNNALNFRLSSAVVLPEDGDYVIDGVSGTAAFSVFYQTDGEISLSYVKGGKEIDHGVEIKNGETDFSFEVDGTTYQLDIPAGTYSQKEIIDKLNGLLQGAGAPVTAVAEEGNLKLQYIRYGQHKISNVSGLAKKELFFVENSIEGEREGIPIQCGGDFKDYVVIDRPVLNTVSLGINSITISRPKYAQKAIEQLKNALAKVSTVRGYFGSMQNRLEHTISNNENRSENTTAAESRVRDTDMAKTVMENSKYHILQNSAQALMTHTRQQAEEVLNLLR